MTSAEIGFDSKRYLELQSAHIKERMSHFGKLYLEFGGKLFDDYHASRVLPGFTPDIKLQMLEQLKGQENVTLDGRRIMVYCNIGSLDDVEVVLQNDGGGIGLFRSCR